MNKELELFKKEFIGWQEKFGLNGWRVYFQYEPIDKDRFADITPDLENMSALVRLNSDLVKDNEEFKDNKRSAKHEAIHLLLARLSQNGQTRFLNRGDYYESEEELVHKLEDLIK